MAKAEIHDKLGQRETHALCEWHVHLLRESARRHGIPVHSLRGTDDKAVGGQ